jgi:hypothetical protein
VTLGKGAINSSKQCRAEVTHDPDFSAMNLFKHLFL